MTYGITIWNSDGSVKLSVSDRLTRVLGTATVNLSPNQYHFITVPNLYTSAWSARVCREFMSSPGVKGDTYTYLGSEAVGANGGVMLTTGNFYARYSVVFYGI